MINIEMIFAQIYSYHKAHPKIKFIRNDDIHYKLIRWDTKNKSWAIPYHIYCNIINTQYIEIAEAISKHIDIFSAIEQYPNIIRLSNLMAFN
jgi:hypothetical protein